MAGSCHCFDSSAASLRAEVPTAAAAERAVGDPVDPLSEAFDADAETEVDEPAVFGADGATGAAGGR